MEADDLAITMWADYQRVVNAELFPYARDEEAAVAVKVSRERLADPDGTAIASPSSPARMRGFSNARAR